MTPDRETVREALAVMGKSQTIALAPQPTHRAVQTVMDAARAWLEQENAIIIQRDENGWQLSGEAWKVLNAAAAFGHPGGSINLVNDLADALSVEQPTEGDQP